MADDGKFSIRPDGAAPLFTSKSGKAAARKRWDTARESAEHRMIELVSEELGREVTLDEAVDYAIIDPQFKASVAGKTAAAKFLDNKLGLTPLPDPETGSGVPQTVQQFNVYNFGTPQKAKEFANQLEEAGEIVLAAMVRAQIDEDEDEQIIEVLID